MLPRRCSARRDCAHSTWICMSRALISASGQTRLADFVTNAANVHKRICTLRSLMFKNCARGRMDDVVRSVSINSRCPGRRCYKRASTHLARPAHRLSLPPTGIAGLFRSPTLLLSVVALCSSRLDFRDGVLTTQGCAAVLSRCLWLGHYTSSTNCRQQAQEPGKSLICSARRLTAGGILTSR